MIWPCLLTANEILITACNIRGDAFYEVIRYIGVLEGGRTIDTVKGDVLIKESALNEVRSAVFFNINTTRHR